MEKSKIVIGILIGLFMFSYVKAESIVDFDGKSPIQKSQNVESFSMPEAFSDIEYNIPVPKREVKYEIENNTQSGYKGVTKEISLNVAQGIYIIEIRSANERFVGKVSVLR